MLEVLEVVGADVVPGEHFFAANSNGIASTPEAETKLQEVRSTLLSVTEIRQPLDPNERPPHY